MSRTPMIKELVNTRLASGYGGWIYCQSCGKNIGFLCYVTYHSFRLEYKCECGSYGNMQIAFGDVSSVTKGDDKLITIKHRLCCPNDQSPLFTVLEKSLSSYKYQVVCKACNKEFSEEKI